MIESFQKFQVFPRPVIWDFSQTKAFLHPRPPIKITTELKGITRQVNVEPLLRTLSMSAKTTIPELVTVSQELPHPLPNPLLATDFPRIAELAYQLGEELLVYSALFKVEPKAVEIPASPTPLKVTPETERVTTAPLTPFLSTVNELASFLAVSERKRRAFVLQEIVEGLRAVGQQLADAAHRKKQELEEALRDLERHIGDLLVPRPAPTGAVMVSGRPVLTGPIRERDEPQPSAIHALVLSQSWQPERRLSLPIVHSPVLKEGSLTLGVRVDDPELVGRHADLVLVAEEVEVALASVPVVAKGKTAELVFNVDLASAGLRLRNGELPLHVLQIIIEPTPIPKELKGSNDEP